MSHLILVRHGQASVDGDDYDVLSARGEAQARALGEHWRRLDQRFERVFVGPRVRHQRTCEIALDAWGGDVPEPERLASLDEHSGQALFLGRDQNAPEVDLRTRLKDFRDVTRRWVGGELAADPRTAVNEAESWSSFRQRVAGALATIVEQAAGGTTVAFTSGGPVAAAVGHALGLDDMAVLELSWSVRNAAVAELRLAAERMFLISFNAAPHFTDPDLVTFI